MEAGHRKGGVETRGAWLRGHDNGGCGVEGANIVEGLLHAKHSKPEEMCSRGGSSRYFSLPRVGGGLTGNREISTFYRPSNVPSKITGDLHDNALHSSSRFLQINSLL